MEKSRDMTVGVGTVAYMAPELMRAFSEHAAKIEADGTKCDMYSFAILALYVATSQTPYNDLSNENIFIKVGMRGGRTDIPPGYAGMNAGTVNNDEAAAKTDSHDSYGKFVALVECMWKQDPEERPGFDTVIIDLEKVFSSTVDNVLSI